MSREYVTEFPNASAIRAAALIASNQTESEVEEFADCLRDIYNFGGDETFAGVRRRRRRMTFEKPSPEGYAALKTIRSFLDTDGADDLKAKCQASAETEEDTFGFSIFLFLLLQVIAVYIRRWLEKVLP